MAVEMQPLRERVSRLSKGYPAHPEYVPCVIQSFAELPMSAYLQGFESEKEKLSMLLGMETGDIDGMTYKDIACLIYEVKEQGDYEEIVEETVAVLAAPFQLYWQQRKERYGKSQ